MTAATRAAGACPNPSMTALRLLPLLLLAPFLKPAPAPAAIAPGVAEHTVTAYRIERAGAVERDERVETWVSARRAKAVHTDAATGAVLGACTSTRRVIRCFDRDPALELAGAAGGELFVPSWAATARHVRKGLRRGWLVRREKTEHRGVAARRLDSTAGATGDAGATTTLLAERGTLELLFRQSTSPDGTIVATEDVLSRAEVRAASVDFRLHAPEGEKVRRRAIPAPRSSGRGKRR